MQNFQKPDSTEARIVPKWLSPHHFSDKNRFISAAQKLYWLLLSTQKMLTMEGGGFFRVAGANWGRLGAPQQHLQPSADRPSPNSTHPKCSAYFNVTSTSFRSSTVGHTDFRASWTPCRYSTKASAPWSYFKEPQLPSTTSYWECVAHHLQQPHIRALQGLGSSQRGNKLSSKLHMHSS